MSSHARSLPTAILLKWIKNYVELVAGEIFRANCITGVSSRMLRVVTMPMEATPTSFACKSRYPSQEGFYLS